ncbi:MAG: hypothetical protein N3D83_02840 [Pyrobaculum aerophilum]|nr:hypothetical protein [Pyrobaculum aerophilum]
MSISVASGASLTLPPPSLQTPLAQRGGVWTGRLVMGLVLYAPLSSTAVLWTTL